MIKKVIGIAAVLLVFAAFIPGLNAQTILVDEAFEGTVWPPTGWSTDDAGGGTAQSPMWNFTTYWGRSNLTSGSGDCASADSDINDGTFYDRALLTPVVDATGLSDLRLMFDCRYEQNGGSDGEEGRVEVHSNGDWTQIALYNSDFGSGQFMNYPIGFADGFDDVQVRFVYDGNYEDDDWEWYFQVDNVVIQGSSGSGGEFDLEMADIISPLSEEEGGVALTPACQIYSNAEGQVTAKVLFRIKDFNTQQTVYEDILNDFPLDPGYNSVDAFKTFTPEGNTRYEALAVVTNDDDENHDNDDVNKQFQTIAGMEVTPTVVLAPVAEQLNSFAPKATYLEGAGAASTEAMLHCKIETAGFFAVYEDSTTATFTANQSQDITFFQASLEDGDYTVTFWATDGKGVTISENPLTLDFTYTGVEEEPIVERYALNVSGSDINFTLGNATTVNMRVYDIAGNLVATLASGSYSAGTHTVSFDANTGVYFVKMVTPEFSTVEKLMRFH